MRTKIEQFLQSLEAQNSSRNTIRAYRRDVADFVSFLGPESESAPLSRRQIRNYLVHLNGQGLQRSSVARKLAAVKSLLHWLAAEGLIEQDVAASILAPRIPKKIPPWHSEEEIEQLLDGEIFSRFPERDRLIQELLYATGVRVAELSGINIDDFRDEDAILIRGKGKRERLVIFGECAQDALRAYLPVRQERLKKLKRETNALLFGLRGPRVERLTERNLSRIVKTIARQKGLPARHPHAFRHAMATHMLDHGASIVVVSKLLGHAKLSTTEQYTHISRARMLQTYNAAHPHAQG
jgi:integrase/recombinase XerC